MQHDSENVDEAEKEGKMRSSDSNDGYEGVFHES